MFTVELVALAATVLMVRDIVDRRAGHRLRDPDRRSGSGSPCCSPPSPRRSPKAAARRRPTRCAACAARPWPRCCWASATCSSRVRAHTLKVGEKVLVEAGDLVPGDGEIIEGVATIDESAITGESAPVIREAGGDRSAVTGGTRVLSDRIKVRITAEQGSSFLDRMIALVEGAARQKTPNELALSVLLAGLTLIFVLAVVTIPSFADLCRRRGLRGRADRAVRHPDPDDHRRAAVGHRHRRHEPAGALQRAGHVGPRRRGGGRRRHAAARQDRHHHAGQPPCHAVHPGDGRRPRTRWREAAQLASLADETPEGRSIVVLAKEKYGLRGVDVAELQGAVRALHGADPHERRRHRGRGDPQGRRRFGGRACALAGRRAADRARSSRIADDIAKEGGTPLACRATAACWASST